MTHIRLDYNQKSTFMACLYQGIVLALMGLVFISGTSYGTESIIELEAPLNNLNPRGKIFVLEDKNGTFSAKALLAGTMKAHWRKSDAETMSAGYTSSVYWLKTMAINTSSSKEMYLIRVSDPQLDVLDVFVQHNERLDTWNLGDDLPFNKRPIHHRTYVVPVTMMPGEIVSVLIRVKTTSSMQIPFSIWTEDEFVRASQTETLGLSAYYGAMVVMILYNVFMFITIRERSYFYYVMYVMFMVLWAASHYGSSFQYLWPESVWWNDHVVVFALNGIVLFGVLFIQSFLKIREHYPKHHAVFMAFGVVAGIHMVGAFVFSYHYSIYIVLILVVPTMVYGYALACARFFKKDRPAGVFLLAWTMMLVGALVMIMNKFGMLPRNFMTENAVQLGSVLEVTLLSYALASRLNHERKGRVQAQEVAHFRERQSRLADEKALLMEKRARIAQEQVIEAQANATRTLRRQVEEQTLELSQALERAKGINSHILSSLDYARVIQQALIAEGGQLSDMFTDSFVWWEPRDKVGGDYYMITQVNGNRLIAVGDCTGHGVPGSFMTILVHYLLSWIVHEEKCFDPGEILAKLNGRIKNALKQNTAGAMSDEGLDIGICLIDQTCRYIEYSGARLDLHYTHNHAIHTIKADKQSVGYVSSKENHVYPVHKIPVLPKMVVYLNTDGITDQPGESSGMRFGKQRLKKVLVKLSHQPLNRQCEGLKKALVDHQGQRNRVDDLTVVAFRPEIS